MQKFMPTPFLLFKEKAGDVTSISGALLLLGLSGLPFVLFMIISPLEG